MKQIIHIILFISVIGACDSPSNRLNQKYDVIVYGGTPAGIIAAVTAADHGCEVLLVEQKSVLGGMYTSGLNTAESEHMINNVITGRAREFFVTMGEMFYDSAYFQTFGNGRGLNFTAGDPAFFFESKHAKAVFNQMIGESNVDTLLNSRLTEVIVDETSIVSVVLNGNRKLKAKYYVDCSYEGDLMAKAGVSCTYGREPVDQYNESLAGIRLIDDTLFARTVDEKENLLKWFNTYDTLIPGSSDKKVMNYNFRPTMTKDTNNMRSITAPEGYNPDDFSLLADFLQKNPETRLGKLIGVYPRGSGKYEFNNQQSALVSLGMFGGNTGYTEGNYETRKKIYAQHEYWTRGYLYFLVSDPRVPKHLREETARFGYAKDEFVHNDNFPYYLYIREARRMISDVVQTQHDIFVKRTKDDAVFLGSHWVDCHHVQRIAISDSAFINEGRIWEIVHKPFEISYRTLVPKKQECQNLIVPVCASFSHVGYCAYRLESTWMQAGHVAGIAVKMAMNEHIPLQELNIIHLQDELRNEGLILKNKNLDPYDDYDWMVDHERYGKIYDRMYPDNKQP